MPYIGEIRMFAGSFPPVGWMFCDGTPIPISENDALFVVIGTLYGGDGQETFNLPDLRGRTPRHKGSLHTLAEAAGTEAETLTTNSIPAHNHAMLAANTAPTNSTPGGNLTAAPASKRIYIGPSATQTLHASSISPTGGSQPHENMGPYLCINFIISLFGVFPSET
jgi:microcystin-dependent protein